MRPKQKKNPAKKPAQGVATAPSAINLQQALELHQKGQLAEARAAYEQVLAVQPNQFEVLHWLGVIALQTRDFKRAVELIGRAIEIHPADPMFHSNLGAALKELRQFEAAIASYNKAIALRPDLASVYSNRGNAQAEFNQTEAALASYDQAIAIKPDYAEAYYNRGNVQKKIRRFEVAIASYDKAIAIKPDFAEAHSNRGIALQELKQFEAAIASYDKAIAIKPDFADAHFNRGNSQKELNQLEAAIASYDRAIAIKPDFSGAWSNRGNALQGLKRFDDAIASYERALAIKPDFVEAWSNLGNAQKALKQLPAAIASYDRAIAIKPDFADGHCNRGVALQELKQMDAAIASYEKAIALKPDYVEAHYNRGNALQHVPKLDEAIASYDQALALRPDYAEANFNKAVSLLLKGDFLPGWALYEWRWKQLSFGLKQNTFPQPLWLGRESLQGKRILLHPEQGLGDTIQFCRYAKVVSEMGATVMLGVPKPLVGLLRGLEGVSRFVDNSLALPEFDYHCPLMSLPLACKTELHSIPGRQAYLHADAGKVSRWQQTLGFKTKPRAGLVWSGNTAHLNDANRSVALSALIPHLPDTFEYVSLQKEIRESDKPTLAAHPHIRFFGDEIEDFTDTAALCELMDVVISVDTSVAHLSGAIGKRTWILLPFSPDARWMLDRSDSPWYPSVRLYRQRALGDWTSTLNEVTADLARISDSLADRKIITNSLSESSSHSLPDSSLQQIKTEFQRAHELYQKGRPDEAKTACEHILKMQPDHFDSLHLLGVIALQAQDYQSAAALIGKAVGIHPDNAVFHSNLGAALQGLGQYDAAIASYEKAIALKPQYAEAYSNRGAALQALKQLETAIASYDKAVAIKPDYADAWFNRGTALQAINQLDDAIASYDKVVAIKPDFVHAYYNRGIVQKLLDRSQAAVASYDQAIAIRPDFAEAWSNRGLALQELNQLKAAIVSFDKAIAIKPDFADAYYNRGNAEKALRRIEAAIASYDRATALKPDLSEAWSNRGNALLDLHQPDAAIASYDRAIAIKPDYADAYLNRGNALQVIQQLEAARASYDKAIAIRPDFPQAHFNKAIGLLLGGDFNQGLPLHEWRWQCRNLGLKQRPYPQPLWLGRESLQGKRILLHSEAGFGDTLHFCRYATLVSQLGATVMLEAPKSLLGALKGLEGVSAFFEDGAALPEFDYHCPLMSLPLAFKTELSSIPAKQAYLHSDSEKVSQWREKLGVKKKPRIGLVWSGNSGHKNDFNRSLTLASITPYLVESFDYVSLQKELRDTDKSALTAHPHIRYFGDEIQDFSDTAALCQLMDIVISVDTSIAHLSGALGKPTWILLPFSPDWRWLLNRSDSPWYPSARLYRQEIIGDWNAVLEKVRADLLSLPGQHSDGQATTNLFVNPASITIGQALALHQKGQLSEAEAAYEQILNEQANHFDALHLLGVIAFQTRDYPRAIELIGKAIALHPGNVDFYCNLGPALRELGRFDDAVASFDKAIELRPDHADTHYQRGITLHTSRRFEAAIESYDKTIAIKPDHASAHSNRGVSMYELGRIEAAIASYDAAIAIKPDFADAHANRGAALHGLKQFESAVASYQKAIALRPDHAQTYVNLGAALRELNQIDAAIACCQQAIALKPDYAEAYAYLGLGLHELKQFEAAIESCNKAIAIKPDCAEAYLNRGLALNELRQFGPATDSCNKAIAIRPDYAEAYLNRGLPLNELRQFDAAIASYDMAIAIRPDYAEAYSNRGIVWQQLMRIDAAIADYDKAIAIKPDCAAAYLNKSLSVLLKGDFTNGWALYEWRWKQGSNGQMQRAFPQPLWLGGESLQGKTILLYAEQGLGDTLQFCRYASLLSQAGAKVLLEAPKALIGLLQGVDGISRVIETGAALPEFDVHCPLMSLPLAFKTDLASIPAKQSYLYSDVAKVSQWREKLGVKNKPRVGLVWSGIPGHKNDHNRSLALASITPYLPDIFEYISLQKEIRESDKPILAAHPHIRFFGDQIQDFSDTAALCELMDIVISVDTSVAHLSGALGKPTWVLLPFNPDWRWLLDRSDSPWYPSVCLYRQTAIGDWTNVLNRVRADLVERFNPPPAKTIDGNPSAESVQPGFEQAAELHQKGQLAQAKAAFEEILKQQPRHFDSWHRLGIIALQTQDHQGAVELIGKAIEIHPGNADFHSNLAAALQGLKQFAAASASCDRAIAIKPSFADAHYNQGLALQELRQFEAALASYDKAIASRPNYAEAYCTRGVVQKKLRRLEAAIASYDKAIAIRPDYVEAWFNRGIALKDLNQFHAAIASYDQALAIRPNYAEAYSNRGNALQLLTQLDAAIANYDQAIAIRPNFADALYNKSTASLMKGDFDQGWAHYEWRWKSEGLGLKPRDFPQPLWLGKESLQGKRILLHSEQGFGDTLQFCRYAKRVSELGATVILAAPKPLLGVLQGLEGVSALVDSLSTFPEFDVHCPLLSLPLTFKTRLNSIPGSQAYLKSDASKLAHWNAVLGTKTRPRIGLVWSGNAAHGNDANRSIALSSLIPYLPNSFDYISLQKEIRESDKATLTAHPEIRHLGDQLQDFSDTAALCKLMDRVVSVDTSVAHLSGALGKHTWIMLPFCPDWRWLLDRSDSPWYPTVRLYRQDAIGDWASALGKVKADLEAFAGRVPGTAITTTDSSPQRIQTSFQQALTLHQQGQLAQAKAAYEQILAEQPDHFDCLHLLGVIAFQTNDHARAIELIGKAISIYPGNADFHSNLGNAQQGLKQFAAAIASYDKAIALKPDFADAHSNRGAALKELGQLEPAIAAFDRAIAINPDFARAWSNRGNAQKELGQFAAAVASYNKLIALQPGHAEACLNRGIALQALKQFEAAIASYDQAIAIKPDFAEAWSNRGVALKDLKQLQAALASIDKAIAIRPEFADAYSNRGNTLQDLKQLEAAIASYDKAIAIQPDFAAAWSNRGTALQSLNRMEDAIASFDKAVAIQPDYAEAWFNRGVALKEIKRLSEAIASYDRAIAVRPAYSNANYNKAAALLLNGDLAEGWSLYEWRWKCESLGLNARSYSQPLWLGKESLKDKHILLHSEQGFGDTLQFCRYAKLVSELGATVTMEVPQALTGLLQGLEGVSQLVAEGLAPSEFDFHCPLLSLPLAFKTELDSIPSSRAYLKSDADKVAHWNAVLGAKTRPRIGLAWSGNTKHTNDANRSIPLSALIPHLPNSFDYVSLQKELRDNDKAALATHPHIRFVGDQIRDFSDTAALCELMDIVIGVDTSVAHLSGALGKTTWILLPFRPDWRWLLDRSDSPWYPSVRLYRQDAIGDWASALSKIKADLEALAGRHRHTTAITTDSSPQRIQTTFPQALSLHQQGQLAQAKAAYEQILAEQPDHFDCLHLLGVIAFQTNDHARAIELIGKAIALYPGNANFHSNLGNAQQGLKQFAAAIASFDKAIALKPEFADAHSNRGNTLQDLKQLEAAIASYDKAIAIQPDYAAAWSNRGTALQSLNRMEDAIASFDKAVAIKPDYAEAWFNRGVALKEIKRLSEAIASYDRAIAVKPDYADAYSNRGIVLQQLMQVDAAVASYDKAIAINPECAPAYLNKSLSLLLKGDYENGWKLYEWRWKHSSLGLKQWTLPQPLWLGGESLQGKTIFLHSEQGLGDTIQFCRYAKLVRDMGATVLMGVPTPLLGLLQGLEGVSRFVERGAALPEFDTHCPLMSLPLAFKTRLDNIPSTRAYLYSDAAKVSRWQQKLGIKHKPRIGLVWNGDIKQANDVHRSLALSALIPFLPDTFEYISLQKEIRESDKDTLASNSHIRFFGDEIEDFTDTAALCELMDVVISVCTSVAHLSGALGKTTWILLPFNGDWRWLLNRNDSPWYPSVRLYRQDAIGDWAGVLGKLRADLEAGIDWV